MKYKNIDRILGLVVFAVAAVTYCLTIEPTASFWDCPEFITTGYKLEVGHPPGAPIFMLTANLFSHFAKDPTQVAMMVNIMSALLSALCILFLFWTITYLAKKLVVAKDEEPTLWQTIAIMGAGIVGALAYTWSDTFWFSAVEGEVYAYSSFCTAVTFWLILKWEESCDEPHSDRWLVLIAYLIGVSVGVHLLNLLCITAIVLVYYFKRSANPTYKGGFLAFCISGVIIALVLYGIVPGIVKVGGWFELLAVNTMKLPFNTGLIIYIILLVASILWSVTESHKGTNQTRMNLSFIVTIALTGIPFYGHTATGVVMGIIVLAVLAFYLFSKAIDRKYKPSSRLLNTIMLSVMMITVGYSSYALIVIRSTANPPMDQNSPEDIFTLGEYLGREQYGSRPLLYGQTCESQIALRIEGNSCYPIYTTSGKIWGRKEKASADEKDSYYVKDDKRAYKYAQNMVFPRMYSPDPDHKAQYEAWCDGIKGKTVLYDNCGRKMKLKIPTQGDNLKFFIRYQVNFMYWRYFMWNFVGRQNDIQGNGEIYKGNWITGVNFIDKMLVGDQRLLPEMYKGKGRNVFYGLPLILGLLGLFWQAGKGREGLRQFWVVLCLFFMTGLAIVLYLNQTPLQPRERDYAYAGSFYAFAIWIGLGVTALAEILEKLAGKKASAIIATLFCLLIPIQMVSQTWDDHDRSGRYACRDFGQNYLTTLSEGNYPIIFTNGDNDTFPLWYNLEIEGFRRDTRCCNLSYLQTDWYIDQMKRPAYDSPSLPIEYGRIDYETGTNDYIPVRATDKESLLRNAKTESEREAVYNSFELKSVLEYWVRRYHAIPTDTIWMKIDKDAVLRSGMYIPKEYLGDTPEETKAKMPDRMIISLKGKDALIKSELMMLELLEYCNWERPLYMATTVGNSSHLGLNPYFVLEGMAYRITPFNFQELGYVKNPNYEFVIDSEKMYRNLMNFKFGGLDNPDLYLDETIRRMCYSTRRLYAQLALTLLDEGQKEKAYNVLERLNEGINPELLPHDYICYSTEMARCYIELGHKDKAKEILMPMSTEYLQILQWTLSLDNRHFILQAEETNEACKILYSSILPLMQELDYDEEDTFKKIVELFNGMYQEFRNRLG